MVLRAIFGIYKIVLDKHVHPTTSARVIGWCGGSVVLGYIARSEYPALSTARIPVQWMTVYPDVGWFGESERVLSYD